MVTVHTNEARRGSFNARIKGSSLGFGRGTLFSGVKGKWELKELGISAGRQQLLLTWWSVGGPTKSDEIFDLLEWKQCSNAREWKLGNFEWWVMSDGWWVMSDEKVLTKQGLSILNCRELQFPMYPCYSSLESLYISYRCDTLKSFPLHIFPKLHVLRIETCSKMESLSVLEGHHLFDLISLKIEDCPNFLLFPVEDYQPPISYS